jgi:hypothetical protein
MTKTELIAELTAKDFCGKVIGVQEIDLDASDYKRLNNIKVYHVHYMEIVGKCVHSSKIPIYVFDEGVKDKEAAYYGEREPAQQIQVTEEAEV